METLEPVCSWHESMCASCHLRPYRKNTENLKEAFGLLQKKMDILETELSGYHVSLKMNCTTIVDVSCFLRKAPQSLFLCGLRFVSLHIATAIRVLHWMKNRCHMHPSPKLQTCCKKKNISGGLRFLTALAPRQHNYQLIDRSTAHVCNNLLSKF